MTLAIEESASCSTTCNRNAAHRTVTGALRIVPRGTAARETAHLALVPASTGDLPATVALRRAAVRALFPAIAAQLAAKHGGAA